MNGGDYLDKNIEFLNYIYQNAEMGKNTISQLIDIVEDPIYKKFLQLQLEEYASVYSVAEEMLKKFNKEGKNINVLSKASTYTMINLKTLTNKSPSHISEMLIQGNTMGIIDLTKKIKEYANTEKEILDLANKLLEFEKENIEECKKYL